MNFATDIVNGDVFIGSDKINDDTMFRYSGQISWLEQFKLVGEKVLLAKAAKPQPKCLTQRRKDAKVFLFFVTEN